MSAGAVKARRDAERQARAAERRSDRDAQRGEALELLLAFLRHEAQISNRPRLSWNLADGTLMAIRGELHVRPNPYVAGHPELASLRKPFTVEELRSAGVAWKPPLALSPEAAASAQNAKEARPDLFYAP